MMNNIQKNRVFLKGNIKEVPINSPVKSQVKNIVSPVTNYSCHILENGRKSKALPQNISFSCERSRALLIVQKDDGFGAQGKVIELYDVGYGPHQYSRTIIPFSHSGKIIANLKQLDFRKVDPSHLENVLFDYNVFHKNKVLNKILDAPLVEIINKNYNCAILPNGVKIPLINDLVSFSRERTVGKNRVTIVKEKGYNDFLAYDLWLKIANQGQPFFDLQNQKIDLMQKIIIKDSRPYLDQKIFQFFYDDKKPDLANNAILNKYRKNIKNMIQSLEVEIIKCDENKNLIQSIIYGFKI